MTGGPRADRALPTILFAGPLKTGTTWIYDYLCEVPQVQLPRGTKETFFFDRYFQRGVAFYSEFFPSDGAAARVRVEVAPSYAGDPSALSRAAATLENVIVVFTVREPVARTLSQYRHEVRYGYYDTPLNSHLNVRDSIVRRSMYPDLMAQAVRAFGSGNVKLLFFEELVSDPELFCARVCEVVGVDYVAPSKKLMASVSNEGQVPRSRVVARTATRLADFLKSHRMNAVTQAARTLGLRRLLERPAKAGEVSVSDAERAQVRELLQFDYAAFEHDMREHVPPPAAGFRPVETSPDGGSPL